MKWLLWFFVSLAVILGAFLLINNYVYQEKQTDEPQLVGGDKTEEGCLGSAGYTWCDARQACERPWERYCTTATPKVVLFTCADSKTITATFYPADDQFVDLVMSDGTNISLPRAMSGSGARYAKDDESIVFWNKGDTAFVTQNGTTTFAECVKEE